MAASSFEIKWDDALINKAVSSPVVAEMCAKKAAEIAAIAREDAPKNRKGSWNMYALSLSVIAWEENGVVHSAVQADRHPLLVEFGWKDKAGRRHPGWHTLKNSLMKARMR
ncbi:hypothetical protein ACN20G_23460 [Streptomyces sp. BI20]|uniref:hypothetical protein n=1 Tax=Streptomyces sp. BI20 TaxID=3403460 RepID=UPI003C77B707